MNVSGYSRKSGRVGSYTRASRKLGRGIRYQRIKVRVHRDRNGVFRS